MNADYSTQESLEASSEDIQQMMVQKAHELFNVCDKEEKGFITKRDMQRLQTELPLTPDQLEDVFDSLDDDGNGYLTLEEFTEGFGGFLGLANKDQQQASPSSGNSAGDTHVYEDGVLNDSQYDEEHFDNMLDHVGAREVFDDMDSIKNLWAKLKEDQPELLGSFEEFLSRVTTDIKKSQTEFLSLESVLRNKSSLHDEEMRKLYEEMEQQIKHEKERVINEERAKERQLKEEMEKELHEKDKQLQELLLKHQEMESKLHGLNHQEAETKQENEKLQKERDKLENQLQNSQLHLEESRVNIYDLKQKQRSEKRDRAMAALHISEGIALERESLVKQLDMLRDMNKKLRDERDEAAIRRSNSWASQPEENGDRLGNLSRCDTCDENEDVCERLHNHSGGETSKKKLQSGESFNERRKRLAKRGSVMSDYFGEGSQSHASPLGLREESVEFDDTDLSMLDDNHNLHGNSFYGDPIQSHQASNLMATGQNDLSYTNGDIGGTEFSDPNISPLPSTRFRHKHQSFEGSDSDLSDSDRLRMNSTPVSHNRRNHNRSEARLSQFLDTGQSDSSLPRHKSLADELSELERHSDLAAGDSDLDNIATSPRKEPVGANSNHEETYGHTAAAEDLSHRSPERLFKVVFVGDSGVGKSSFIHRFCNNAFKHTFSATIGVDFQVKNVLVENHLVALQLWDTAGQERFRSITKQYFRKADGVVIMYDVTSETSYKNVRNWMVSVQEGTDEETVLVLIGNKIDLIDDLDDNRIVTTKSGSRLADDYGALFYETSAKSGAHVTQALQGMASLLQEREDRQIEKSLHINDEQLAKKKGCCD